MKMDMKLKRTTTHFVFLASRNSLEGAAEKADHLLYSIVCMAFGIYLSIVLFFVNFLLSGGLKGREREREEDKNSVLRVFRRW